MRIGKEVLILSLDDILPNRFQPRIAFDEQAILELSESIKEHGVIQPIVVRRIADKYEIIAGERRYKASVLAGKKSIPAILADLNDKDSAEVALIENVQRQDLTPIEEAISYKKILDMGYLNQAELAAKLGKTQSTIANKLRLLNLCDEVQEALMKEKISERHARSLLRLNETNQKTMLSRIIGERLTVRKTDEEIDKLINSNDENKSNEKIIEEQKGEGKMLNDNNSQNTNNYNSQMNPTFPGFNPTNIEESKPINFGLNTESSNDSSDDSTGINIGIPTNIFGQSQPAQPTPFGPEINQNINIEPTPISAVPTPEPQNNVISPDFSNIFGNVQTPQPQVLEQTSQELGQNIFGTTNNDTQTNLNNSSSTSIFGQPQPVEPMQQPEPLQGVNNEVQPNRFFGLFNNNVIKTEDPKPEILNTEPVKETIPEFDSNMMAQRIEDRINNDFLMDNSMNNNIFNFNSNQESNTEDSDNNDGGSSRKIVPNVDVNPNPIEELNFNQEIEPVVPFTLDDNQQFNTQNSQILSQSPSPVAIITPKEIPELEPVMPEQQEQVIGTINDMIKIIRDAIDEVESRGYKIDSDEMDLQNTYQITITIQK